MPEDKDQSFAEKDESTVAAAAGEAEASTEADAPMEGGRAEEVSQLLQKLDDLTAEANARRDDYLRAVAELENFRKRALRDKEEARHRAESAVLENFLPILENFSLGLKAAREHEAGKVFVDGFAMVYTQIENLLRQHGVAEVNPHGQPFDPNYHESIAHLPHPEIPEGHVAEVQRIGYLHRDRLLRPASVVVSSGPAESGSTSTES